MSQRTPAQDRWLNFFNRVIYTSLAPLYNSLDWLTFGAWWRLLRRALDDVPAGQRVLEVSFGPGKLQVELARRSALCAGIDLAEGMCRFTQRRLLNQGLPNRIAQANVFALPFPANSFDVVVSTFAFSGFPDGDRALREMARVTAPGGRVVLIDIGLPPDGNRLGTVLARLWERLGDFLYDQPAMMAACGLTAVTCEAYGPGKHIRAVVGENPEASRLAHRRAGQHVPLLHRVPIPDGDGFGVAGAKASACRQISAPTAPL